MCKEWREVQDGAVLPQALPCTPRQSASLLVAVPAADMTGRVAHSFVPSAAPSGPDNSCSQV
jgi:hypothetical protein